MGVRVRVSDRLERAEGLDRVVGPVQQVVQKIPPGRVKDALHGVWLGHPVHPMLVQVPVGAFMSAAFLDVLGRDGDGARHLIGLGLLASMPAAELKQGEPAKALLGDVPVFALRDGDEVFVLANKCSHMSGPLNEGTLSDGELTGAGKDRCVTCPWHGSVFRLGDGVVVHGPATADQPAFQTRIRDGIVQVCLPGAG